MDGTGRGNDLADTNASVPQITGKLAFGAGFNAVGTRRLERNHTADLAFGPGVSGSVVCWVKLNSLAANQAILGKFAAAAANSEWDVIFNVATSRFRVRVVPVGPLAQVNLDLNTFGAPSTAIWYMLALSYDSASKTLSGSVNAGAEDSVVLGNDIQSSPAQKFAIGSRADNAAIPLDGDVDAVAKWSRVLTSQERTDLWNGGVGQEHPFWTFGSVVRAYNPTLLGSKGYTPTILGSTGYGAALS